MGPGDRAAVAEVDGDVRYTGQRAFRHHRDEPRPTVPVVAAEDRAGADNDGVESLLDAGSYFLLAEPLGPGVIHPTFERFRGRFLRDPAIHQSVCRDARGVDEPPGAVGQGSLDDVAGAVDVGAGLPLTVSRPVAQVPGNMEHDVDAFRHRSPQPAIVFKRRHHPRCWKPLQVGDVGGGPVHGGDVPSGFDQLFDEGDPNKPVGAGDKCSRHLTTLSGSTSACRSIA